MRSNIRLLFAAASLAVVGFGPSCWSQTLDVQNLCGSPYCDGAPNTTDSGEGPSIFTFAPGNTFIPLTWDFVFSYYNSDLMSQYGLLDLSHDWLVMIYAFPSDGGAMSMQIFQYPIGTLSQGVGVTSINTNSISEGVMGALQDSSVQYAYNGGLYLGAVIVATLFGFTFIRAIPGGGYEDM